MTKNCFITAASLNYLEAIVAQLNSLELINNKNDVFLLSHQLPNKFLEDLEKYSYNIYVVHSQEKDQIQGTAIERFKVAYTMGQVYEAVCLLDADMFVLANLDTFFHAASNGTIITGSNGMIIDFDKEYQQKYGIDLGTDRYAYAKIHTTVPIFLPASDLDWFDKLYNSRRIDHWDDFLYLNILGIKLEKHKRMITMPPYCFTGIHHWMVKPETSVIEKSGQILSGTEELVYMVHGKFFDIGWLSDFEPTMNRYFKDEQINSKGQRRTWYALNLLQKRYKACLCGGPLYYEDYYGEKS